MTLALIGYLALITFLVLVAAPFIPMMAGPKTRDETRCVAEVARGRPRMDQGKTQSLPSRSLRDDSTRQKEEMIMELEHLDKIQEAVDGSTQESIEKLRSLRLLGGPKRSGPIGQLCGDG